MVEVAYWTLSDHRATGAQGMAISIEFLQDVNPTDGYLNFLEGEVGILSVRVHLGGAAIATDIVEITSALTPTFDSATLSAVDITNGYVDFHFSSIYSQNQNFSFDVELLDAGSSQKEAVSDNIFIDMFAPPDPDDVSVLNQSNDPSSYDYIDANEYGAGIQIGVSWTSGVSVGDTITVLDGTNQVDYTVTASDVAAGSATISMAAFDYQGDYTFRAKITDAAGNSSFFTTVDQWINRNQSPTGTVEVVGTPLVGSTLTADTSGLDDPDGLGTFSYQWYNADLEITGATSSTYVPIGGEVYVYVEVTYTDGIGVLERVTSSQSETIRAVNNPAVGRPTIVSDISNGLYLGADLSTFYEPDGIDTSTITYQWLRNGVAIVGATDDIYKAQSADVGANISVEVSYTDNADFIGYDTTLTSAATLVSSLNAPPNAAPNAVETLWGMQVLIGSSNSYGSNTHKVIDPDRKSTRLNSSHVF